MQGWFNICETINVVPRLHRREDKKITLISIDAGKAFDRIQCPFMMSTLNKVGLEGTCVNKGIYDKPAAHIRLSRGRLKALPLRSGTREGCPLIPRLQYGGSSES